MGRYPIAIRLLTAGWIALAANPPLPLAADELRLTSSQGINPEVDLLLISPSEVEGLVAAFDWDGDLFTGLDLIRAPALVEADLVVRRVESSFMVLGVVMDVDGDGEVIPPGMHGLATARFRCLSAPLEGEVSTELTFRDGRYGSVDLGPLLDNILTVGGQTVSVTEGLKLTPGRLTCPPALPGALRIRDAVAVTGAGAPQPGCATADVLLDTPSPVQGFSLAVGHDPAVLNLIAITTAGTVTEASGADFTAVRIEPAGGTVGVVLDLEAPFLENTLPTGVGLVIARFTYCCRVEPPPGGPDVTTPLRFLDGVLGDPPLENVLVVGGRSLSPRELIPGTFTCRALSEDPSQEFRCGGDAGTGTVLPPVVGAPGSTASLCFYYRSVPKGDPGDTGEDRIQGLSMALCYDPRWVECQDGTFDVRGTIVEAVGAEFVNHHCENSTADGDGGELVIGILVDALPPFDGETLPPTLDLLKVGCVEFRLASDAPCGQCFPVQFCDGIDGQGRVPTLNLISVNNFSRRPELFNCEICASASPQFQRGDCNYSRGGALAVDISDPAAVISSIFLPEPRKYRPPCLDACDANDDGRVDFADPVYVLRYLFQFGSPPPPPGPNEPGLDPTEDKLDCAAAEVCP